MNVTPVSLQMVLPRTTDAGQVQNQLNQQALNQQDFAMLKSTHDSQKMMEQVQEKAKTEDGKVKSDPNGRNSQGEYHGKRREATEEDEETEKVAVDSFRGHHIDISF